MPRSTTSAVVFALAAAMTCGLVHPSIAEAAPGDASARGVQIAADAQVNNSVVFTGSMTRGIADAPANGGTDTHSNVGVGLSGGGFNAFGTVAQVTATRGTTASTASSSVSGIEMRVIGALVFSATGADATVSCPMNGGITANASVASATLFGNPVTVGTTPVTASGAVPVVGPTFTGGALSITLQSVEQSMGSDATAIAVTATMTLSVVSSGTPITVPAGTFTLASATCSRPAPGPNVLVASGMNPISGSNTGGQTVTIFGTGFPPGGAIVTFGGVPGTNVVIGPSGTSLTVVAPPHAPGPVAVVVTTPQGSTTVPIQFTYVGGGPSPSGGSSSGGGSGSASPSPGAPQAAIRSITPRRGPISGGTVVSIAGSGFTGVTRVTFNGTAGTGLSVNSAGTVITVTTPPGAAGAATVVLHWGDGRTFSAGLFTFLAQTANASPVASLSTARPRSTPTTADGQLPNTGSNDAAIAWLAATLVAAGALLTRLGRRPPA